MASAQRRQGFTKQAERYYLDVARLRCRDAWWACAAGERGMLALLKKELLAVAKRPQRNLDRGGSSWLRKKRFLGFRAAASAESSGRVLNAIAAAGAALRAALISTSRSGRFLGGSRTPLRSRCNHKV